MRKKITAEEFFKILVDGEPAKNLEVTGEVAFQKNIADASLNINKAIEISNCSFEKIEFSYPEKSPEFPSITFHHCHFNSGISISKVIFQDLKFIACHFGFDISFSQIKLLNNNSLEIEVSSNLSAVGIANTEDLDIIITATNNMVEIGGVYFHSFKNVNLTIQNIRVIQFSAIGKTFLNKLSIIESNIDRIDSSVAFYDLEISSSPGTKTTINTFEFPINLTADIDISNCEITDLKINSLNQKHQNFKLQNVIIKETFELTNSTLNRGFFNIVQFKNTAKFNDSLLTDINFNQVDFKNTKVDFENTFLGNCTFTNIRWPKNHELYSQQDVNIPRDKLLTQQEVYRQLKLNMKNSGNSIDSLAFYQKEMETYWMYIRKNKSINWQNRFLISLNKHVNNFGQDWVRPTILLFIIHFFLFLFMINTGYTNIKFVLPLDAEFGATITGLKEYLRLLFPLHSTDNKLNSDILFIDTLIRINSGFFIYFIFGAGRKYTYK